MPHIFINSLIHLLTVTVNSLTSTHLEVIGDGIWANTYFQLLLSLLSREDTPVNMKILASEHKHKREDLYVRETVETNSKGKYS